MDLLQELEQLVTLAHEPSSDKRRDLLRSIADLFLNDSSSYSEAQSEYFGEIMEQLAYDLEVQVREELAIKLAAEKRVPHDLVQKLANDDIIVAQPILEKSAILTQQDLIEITKTKGQSHLRAITTRPDIGCELSENLETHGDDVTIKGLLSNQLAKLDNNTTKKIAYRARTSAMLQDPLICRTDISENVIVNLYSYVAEELKEKILSTHTDIERSSLEPVLENITKELSSNKALKPEKYIEELARKGILTENHLINFIKDKRPTEFLLSISKMTGLDLATTHRVMEDKSGKSLIVLCKSRKMSQITFKKIAMSSLTSIAPRPSDVLPLLNIYRNFSYEDARQIISFWKTHENSIEEDISQHKNISRG